MFFYKYIKLSIDIIGSGVDFGYAYIIMDSVCSILNDKKINHSALLRIKPVVATYCL